MRLKMVMMDSNKCSMDTNVLVGSKFMCCSIAQSVHYFFFTPFNIQMEWEILACTYHMTSIRNPITKDSDTPDTKICW